MYKPTKRTINWGKDINFIMLFNTKVSRKWQLTPSQVAKDQLTMKYKREEEEKLEKQKKKKDSKALSLKAKG